MLRFDQLSYWEKSTFTEGVDFLVIGAGIVGSACALELRKRYPAARILILERGYLPSGASTKNAGFACFGSVTEIADDLLHMPEDGVWSTVELRWRGLQRLQERFSAEAIDLKFNGSWDLVEDEAGLTEHLHQLDYFNARIEKITGHSGCFSVDRAIVQACGFRGIAAGFHSRLEGELNTRKLHTETQRLLAAAGIHVLYGIEVTGLENSGSGVLLQTNFGELRAAKVAVTVNGFAGKLLGDNRIIPARAQVMVTAAMDGFQLPGTFHYQQGYYYFRSVGNRLLIGGGRNLDKQGETTVEMENTELITEAIGKLVNEKILPGKEVRFDYRWAGIMGVGEGKKPLIERFSPNVGMAVRMGGMGVAIGSLAGEELAGLF